MNSGRILDIRMGFAVGPVKRTGFGMDLHGGMIWRAGVQRGSFFFRVIDRNNRSYIFYEKHVGNYGVE